MLQWKDAHFIKRAGGSPLVFSRYVQFGRQRLAFIIRIEYTIRQFDRVARNHFVRQVRQQVTDTIKSSRLLVVTLDDIPKRFRNVGSFQHIFFHFRLFLPSYARLQVHWAQLPLLQRAAVSHEKSELLLLVRDRESVFDQFDVGQREDALELGHIVKELFDLHGGRKTHNPCDAGPVAPRAISPAAGKCGT